MSRELMLSSRVTGLKPSATVEMTERVRQARQTGRDIIGLSSGDPNLPNRPAWLVYDSQNPMVMELGDNIGAMKPHDTGLCELLGPGH